MARDAQGRVHARSGGSVTLSQRQPRIEDAAWLARVRLMPCLICGRPGSDPAHLRSAAPQYGKRITGMGEKSSDCWVLPLCRTHHEAQHREGDELRWWARHGIADPFAVAMALYGNRTVRTRPRREPKVRVRKPREQRAKVPKGRPLQSRSNWPTGRTIVSRNTLKRGNE
jgi:hypothetical protein